MDQMFQNLVKVYPQLENIKAAWDVSEEFSNTYPKLSFYLKYYVVLNLDPELKNGPLDSPVRKWVFSVLQELKKIKPVIGEFDENYIELKKFIIQRIFACDEDYNKSNFYPELISNYLKLATMLKCLTVFDIPSIEITKINEMGKIISQAYCFKS